MNPGTRSPAMPPRAAQATDTSGFEPLPRRQVVLVMSGVLVALFLSALDQTVVGTAMPSIIADLKGFDRYTWVTTAYLVASTTVVPIVGSLTDVYGRKWFYVVGLLIFLLGSALSGLSQTMNQLIAFRALQGLGGGITIAGAFVAIGDLFPPAERGKYQGLIAAVFGMSSIVGPTLGGIVTDNLSWHWIFYINIPLGIPVVALFILLFPQTARRGRGRRPDFIGIATLALAVVPLLLALSWAGTQYDWGSPQVVGSLVLAALMAAAFVLNEVYAPDPVFPLAIFRNRVVSVSLLASFLTGFGMFGGIIFIPLFFQGVLARSATSSGSFLTPMMLGMVTGAGLSGQALSRLGAHYRLQALTGIGLMALGTFFVTRMGVDTSFGTAIANIVVMGFGLGFTFPVLTIAVQNSVPHHFMGVATASTQFFRGVGGTMGLAVMGTVMSSRFASRLPELVPDEVKGVLSPSRLSDLAHNPQALVSPEARANLQAAFDAAGPTGARLFGELLGAMRSALSGAISDVFLIGLGVVAVAWVAALFLSGVGMEGRSRQAKAASPDPAGAPTGDDS